MCVAAIRPGAGCRVQFGGCAFGAAVALGPGAMLARERAPANCTSTAVFLSLNSWAQIWWFAT
eukprot:4682370-Lingulodinium_polyedra.AAC.1